MRLFLLLALLYFAQGLPSGLIAKAPLALVPAILFFRKSVYGRTSAARGICLRA